MTLSPHWRTRIAAVLAAILAVWLGAGLAQAEYFWPVIITGGLLLLSAQRVFAMPIDALLVGCILFGYLLGNRGFAQISLTGSFPILPAEFVLLVASLILVVQGALYRVTIVRRELINLAILAWIVIGVVRLMFDIRSFGFLAIRDFAMVYYAAFFFIAQHIASNPRQRKWLNHALIAGCLGMAVCYPLIQVIPDFFYGVFTLRGNPIIFYKGDLVGTMLSAGAVLIYVRHIKKKPILATAATLVLLGIALTTNNRASMVGLATVTVLLLLGRQWKFAATQAIAGVVAVISILFFAHLTNTSWRQTPLHGVYERVVSIADPFGQRAYSGENTFFKGDNNRFRAVWWEAVYNETVDGNPWTGLGFGHDLARQFVREYYPEQGEEFDTRSPHNIVLTVFARMGLLGLIPFFLIGAMIAWRIIKSARDELAGLGMWCAAWVILMSACFGVVLEGPMGAVVFWIALGTANSRDEIEGETEETALIEPEPLPNGSSSV